MPSVLPQVRDGLVVCPVTRGPLTIEGDDVLISADGEHRYEVVDGVPILLADPTATQEYLAEEKGSMAREYGAPESRLRSGQQRLDRWLHTRAVGSAPAEAAAQEVLWDLGPETIRLAVGGGPGRWDLGIVNLNIAPFPNVDVVADAYQLPYADDSVDAVLCWAVLEHLEHPEQAVAEIVRVLRPGSRALFSTPFLQAYHGYPSHFQNFTITGQDRLLTRSGLEVERSGAQLGPIFTLLDLAAVAVRSYLPGRLIPGVLSRLLRILSLLCSPLDHRLASGSNGHILASSVFSVARKPW